MLRKLWIHSLVCLLAASFSVLPVAGASGGSCANSGPNSTSCSFSCGDASVLYMSVYVTTQDTSAIGSGSAQCNGGASCTATGGCAGHAYGNGKGATGKCRATVNHNWFWYPDVGIDCVAEDCHGSSNTCGNADKAVEVVDKAQEMLASAVFCVDAINPCHSSAAASGVFHSRATLRFHGASATGEVCDERGCQAVTPTCYLDDGNLACGIGTSLDELKQMIAPATSG